jgi:hypothetical protein
MQSKKGNKIITNTTQDSLTTNSGTTGTTDTEVGSTTTIADGDDYGTQNWINENMYDEVVDPTDLDGAILPTDFLEPEWSYVPADLLSDGQPPSRPHGLSSMVSEFGLPQVLNSNSGDAGCPEKNFHGATMAQRMGIPHGKGGPQDRSYGKGGPQDRSMVSMYGDLSRTQPPPYDMNRRPTQSPPYDTRGGSWQWHPDPPYVTDGDRAGFDRQQHRNGPQQCGREYPPNGFDRNGPQQLGNRNAPGPADQPPWPLQQFGLPDGAGEYLQYSRLHDACGPWGPNGQSVPLSAFPAVAKKIAKEAKFSPKILKQFNKTKLCRFNAVNRCALGPNCPFAHSQDELVSPPDLTKTRLCAKYFRGRCNDEFCNFAHDYHELRSSEQVYKTELCSRWQLGDCKAGNACRYAHSWEELQLSQNLAAAAAAADAAEQKGWGKGQMNPEQKGWGKGQMNPGVW